MRGKDDMERSQPGSNGHILQIYDWMQLNPRGDRVPGAGSPCREAVL
jgi:hypothetical protein